jgi:hypothetical protein
MSPTSWNGASQVNVKLFMRTGLGALTTADDDRSLQLRNMAVFGAPTKRPTPACGNLLVGPPPSALLIVMQIYVNPTPTIRTRDKVFTNLASMTNASKYSRPSSLTKTTARKRQTNK